LFCGEAELLPIMNFSNYWLFKLRILVITGYLSIAAFSTSLRAWCVLGRSAAPRFLFCCLCFFGIVGVRVSICVFGVFGVRVGICVFLVLLAFVLLLVFVWAWQVVRLRALRQGVV
jgi:hypothetical protein